MNCILLPTALARRYIFIPTPRRMWSMSSSRFLVLRIYSAKRLWRRLFSKCKDVNEVLSWAMVGSFGTSSSSSLLSNCPGGCLTVGGLMCLLILVGLWEDSACVFFLGVSASLRAFPYLRFTDAYYGEARLSRRALRRKGRARVGVSKHCLKALQGNYCTFMSRDIKRHPLVFSKHTMLIKV